MNGNNVRLLDLQFGIEGGFGRCDEYAASQTEIDAGTHRCYAREPPAPRSAKNVMPAVCAHKWARIRSRSDMISRTVTRVAYYRVRALLSLPEYTRSAVGSFTVEPGANKHRVLRRQDVQGRNKRQPGPPGDHRKSRSMTSVAY